MAQGGVVVFGRRQPACILRLAPRHFSSPPFYLFSSASTITEETGMAVLSKESGHTGFGKRRSRSGSAQSVQFYASSSLLSAGRSPTRVT